MTKEEEEFKKRQVVNAIVSTLHATAVDCCKTRSPKFKLEGITFGFSGSVRWNITFCALNETVVDVYAFPVNQLDYHFEWNRVDFKFDTDKLI